MSLKFLWLPTMAAVLSLIACGGGGSSEINTASSSTSYTTVASAGELVTYNVNRQDLTYSYEIIDSAYGLTGKKASGSLVKNPDGTYTPTGFAGKLVILENGMMLGGIFEDLDSNGTKELVPVLGTSNPITSASEAAGIYNFISRQCASNSCTNYYGTVQVNGDGAWQTCISGNLADISPTCTSVTSGTTTGISNGRAELIYGGATAGSMLGFKDSSSGQKVLLLDLNGKTGLGSGAVFASTQNLPSSVDGTWQYIHSNGTRGQVDVSGLTFLDSGTTWSGYQYSGVAGTLTENQPWNGFGLTGSGAILLPSGTGLYVAYFGAANSISIGLKQP